MLEPERPPVEHHQQTGYWNFCGTLAGLFGIGEFRNLGVLVRTRAPTADRSLPITLELNANPTIANAGDKQNCNAHTYVMADAIWYITSGGDITVSV